MLENKNNPLADLISDDIYELLDSKGLINTRKIRDYHMRKRFFELRDSKKSAGQAFETLKLEYPYLEYDTIRKIVYGTRTLQ